MTKLPSVYFETKKRKRNKGTFNLPVDFLVLSVRLLILSVELLVVEAESTSPPYERIRDETSYWKFTKIVDNVASLSLSTI